MKTLELHSASGHRQLHWYSRLTSCPSTGGSLLPLKYSLIDLISLFDRYINVYSLWLATKKKIYIFSRVGTVDWIVIKIQNAYIRRKRLSINRAFRDSSIITFCIGAETACKVAFYDGVENERKIRGYFV